MASRICARYIRSSFTEAWLSQWNGFREYSLFKIRTKPPLDQNIDTSTQEFLEILLESDLVEQGTVCGQIHQNVDVATRRFRAVSHRAKYANIARAIFFGDAKNGVSLIR